MKNPLLVLCPDDPHWVPPDEKRLDHLLQSIDLTAESLDSRSSYLAGEKFLDLVAFMGCSPDIRLQPDDDDQPFCHIRLRAPAEKVEFHYGDHTHTPRCPACRTPVNDWKNRIDAWANDSTDASWECVSCHLRAAPWNYNWRRSAGFGRCFIEITNIFPREAIPQQHLLDTLNSHYGINWHYFYQH